MDTSAPPPGRATFEEVVERFGPALWRLTAGYEPDPASREDLYQEILIALWKGLPRFRGEASLRTFVFRIGHNRALTHRARRHARSRRERPIDDALVDQRPRPDTNVERHAERAALLAAVRALSPALRPAVMLYLEGLSAAEIGDVLGITANAAAVRLSRARDALRDLLQQAGTR